MTEAPETQAPAVEAGQAPETGQGEWFNSFEGEDLGYIQNKGWHKENGIKDMLNSYKNLEKMKGVPEERLLKLPEGEDPEGWEKVYQKLGKPVNAEEYGFQKPEGVEIDENRMAWFSKTAHSLNLNKDQHNKLAAATIEYENSIVKQIEERATDERMQELTKLKDSWGKAYDERVELGKRAVREFVEDQGQIDKIEEAMGSNVAVIKLFAKIGEKIGEDKMPATEGDRSFGYSKEQAMADSAKLKAEIKADPIRLAAYNEGKGADYEKLERLRRQASGQ